jgi:hypothetical protein
MTRGRWVLVCGGILLLLLVSGALAFYLTQIPDELANDYKDQAAPEQNRLRKAMQPVYGTFTAATFGIDDRPLKKAKNEQQFVRAIAKVTARELRQLRPARRAVDKAERALARADEDKLFDIPSAPLLDGRGKLPDTEAIAADERRYLARARRFLRDYDRLVSYEIRATEYFRDVGVTIARGFDKIPQTFTSPGQFTGPVEGVIRTLERGQRRFRKRKPPPDVKREHRVDVAAIDFLIARFRDMNAAARRLDNNGLRRAFAALRERESRDERRLKNSITRLITRSSLARSIRELRKREREQLEAFDRL